jgi:hypothetical protein
MGWWRSFRHKVQLARELTGRDLLILVEAWWMLGNTSRALRRVSYEHLISTIRFSPRERTNQDADLVLAKKLQRLVSMAGRLHGSRITCLGRALTLYRMLSRRGNRSRVCIGVSRIQTNMQAHAWVEMEGQAIGEPEDITERFKVLNPVAQIKS